MIRADKIGVAAIYLCALVSGHSFKDSLNQVKSCINASLVELNQSATLMDLYCLQEASQNWERSNQQEEIAAELFAKFPSAAAKIHNIFDFVSKSKEYFYRSFANFYMKKYEIISFVEDPALKKYLLERCREIICRSDPRVLDAWTNVKPKVQELKRHLELMFLWNWFASLNPEIPPYANTYLSLLEITKLNLKQNKISCLPSEMEHLVQLTDLDISENEFFTFPPVIFQLFNLQSLSLSFNLLEIVPSAIQNLTHLKTLKLNNNNLKSLSHGIGHLLALEHVDLSKNAFVLIPSSITSLARLNQLDLSCNPSLQQFSEDSSYLGQVELQEHFDKILILGNNPKVLAK